MSNGFGQYCKPGTPGGDGSISDKPPAFGYNYNSVLLSEAVVLPNIAYPKAIYRPASIYTFQSNVAIVGLWLATSMVNPNGDTVGVFVGKIAPKQVTVNLPLLTNVFFQHISQSTNTISRTGGLSFGEYSGLQINSGESFGAYLTGVDSAVQITYALTVVWITIT